MVRTMVSTKRTGGHHGSGKASAASQARRAVEGAGAGAMRAAWGIVKPEPLREPLSGFWSRRIDDTHRLVYTVERDALAVVACRYHYE